MFLFENLSSNWIGPKIFNTKSPENKTYPTKQWNKTRKSCNLNNMLLCLHEARNHLAYTHTVTQSCIHFHTSIRLQNNSIYAAKNFTGLYNHLISVYIYKYKNLMKRYTRTSIESFRIGNVYDHRPRAHSHSHSLTSVFNSSEEHEIEWIGGKIKHATHSYNRTSMWTRRYTNIYTHIHSYAKLRGPTTGTCQWNYQQYIRQKLRATHKCCAYL